MGFFSSMAKGMKEAKLEKVQKQVDNFAYTKIEIENKIKATKVNHILHLLLTIITAGFWLIVWIVVSISASIERGRYENELKKLFDTKRDYESNKQNKSEVANSIITLSDKDKAELKSLLELKDLNVVTEAEFNEKKKQILDKY